MEKVYQINQNQELTIVVNNLGNEMRVNYVLNDKKYDANNSGFFNLRRVNNEPIITDDEVHQHLEEINYKQDKGLPTIFNMKFENYSRKEISHDLKGMVEASFENRKELSADAAKTEP